MSMAILRKVTIRNKLLSSRQMEMMARTAKSFAASWSRPDALRQSLMLRLRQCSPPRLLRLSEPRKVQKNRRDTYCPSHGNSATCLTVATEQRMDRGRRSTVLTSNRRHRVFSRPREGLISMAQDAETGHTGPLQAAAATCQRTLQTPVTATGKSKHDHQTTRMEPMKNKNRNNDDKRSSFGSLNAQPRSASVLEKPTAYLPASYR